ncbi:MAG: ATP-binding protein, partial [Candidatus Dormibacteraceae bacterium]
AATGILLIAAWRLPAPIPGEVAASAVLLSGANLFAAWLLSRPTRIALDWAWSSYARAHDQTTKARERQAELARLSKGLSESYYQMQQLNLELDRARRAAQEARRLKAEFAAAVSHELRTPLNLIIGFCEMMVLSPSSAYGQRLPLNYQNDLEAIYRNACHISALVDDILDLSQIDADRMALHKDWASLPEIVDEAVATVESLFRDRELTLRTVVADALSRVHVDRTRIRQILINLLSNAARFIDQGGVTIRAEPAGDQVVISVTDTGPGIPAAELPDVFEEFYQVPVTFRRRGGSGLGLTVSKRFAELHGGAMWVESTPGQGSTFFLKLPRADEAHGLAPDGADWDDRVGLRVRGDAERRVLVIDESVEVYRVFQRYLDGYAVLRAAGIANARRHLRAGPVHAVVLGSPKAQSEWQHVRQIPAELAKLPVISCPLHTARQTAVDLGVEGYLVKPVTREQLRSALGRIGRHVRTALIVDDDDEMTRLLTRMMKSLVRGSQCWTAENGRDVIDLLREHRPDALLLDLLMPGMNGYDVLAALRNDPDLRGTPVL